MNPPPPERRDRRIPTAVYLLALSVFCIGTTEFMISGLLPELSASLSVSVSSVGILISSYAVGVAVGGPVLTIATLRVPRKTVLVALLGTFVLGQTLAALAPSYSVLLVARVVTALAHGTFFGVGSVVAAELAGKGRTGRALAVMFAGLTVANVVGVPLGAVVGQHIGWRASFWVVDGLALAALCGVLAFVPSVRAAGRPDLRSELRCLVRPGVGIALATSMLTQAGIFCCFSYLAPLFTHDAGFPLWAVSPLLMVFGAGCFVGNLIGGRLVDRHLLANLCLGIAATVVVLVALSAVSHHQAAVLACVLLLGISAFSINPALQAQVLREAGQAPTLASTTNTSAFNVGNTVGPLIGGLAIDAGLGYSAPAWAGALLVAGGLATAACAGLLHRRGRARVATPPDPFDRTDRRADTYVMR